MTKPLSKDVPTVMTLEQRWMLVALEPLQPKQYGQLKTLRNKCGPDTRAIVEWAMDSWPEFTTCVRRLTGYESVPSLPHVGFLLRFYLVAVAMMMEECPQQVAYVAAKEGVASDVPLSEPEVADGV